MAIAKRKPAPGNRRARRAAGVVPAKPKRPPPAGGDALARLLRRLVRENDPDAVESSGLMMGDRGWLFHKNSAFAYAVLVGKTRVTLHVMPMYCDPSIRTAFLPRIRQGKFAKGCISFKPDAAPDPGEIAALIQRCARA